MIAFIFLSLVCISCSSGGGSSSNNNPDVSQNNQQGSNGVIDLGTGKAFVTEMLDESRYNFLEPKGLGLNIVSVKAHFRFSSQGNTQLFVDPDYDNLPYCNGVKPTVTFNLQDSQSSVDVPSRTRIAIASSTDYVLNVTLSNLKCTEDSVALMFGLRLGNP